MKLRSLWCQLPAVLVMISGGCGTEDGQVTPSNNQSPKQEQATPLKPAGSQSSSPNPPNGAPAVPGPATALPVPEQTREEFSMSIQEKLNGLQADIDKLETRLKEGAQELQARYQSEFKPALNNKMEDLKARLAKAKDQAEPEWEKFKSDMQAAVADLKSSYEKAVEALK